MRALDSHGCASFERSGIQQIIRFDMSRRAGGVATDLEVANRKPSLKRRKRNCHRGASTRSIEHALALLVGQNASTFRIPERILSTTPPLIRQDCRRNTGTQAGYFRR